MTATATAAAASLSVLIDPSRQQQQQQQPETCPQRDAQADRGATITAALLFAIRLLEGWRLPPSSPPPTTGFSQPPGVAHPLPLALPLPQEQEPRGSGPPCHHTARVRCLISRGRGKKDGWKKTTTTTKMCRRFCSCMVHFEILVFFFFSIARSWAAKQDEEYVESSLHFDPMHLLGSVMIRRERS